ncbi:DUF3488 and DUF4129 domain-containing transglutaminase family protein [Pseudoalteromonas sp. Ld20]|uniref:transglutaminase TgpA family protein n=1 Tax=Pseudoalteromonas sp. Ld20 TaxID=649165 RepID=UPI003869920D
MNIIPNHKAINLSLCVIYSLVLCFIFPELPPVFNSLLVALCIWNGVTILSNRNKPNAVIANILAALSLFVLFYDVGFSDTVTLFVAMLILSSLFKLLQATTKKHYQTITLLSFFSLSTVYLFSQSILATLIISALYILNFSVLALIESKHNLKVASKKSAKLLLLALPIAVFLLLFLPKLPAFWQLPGPKLAKTGLSESVNPFDIAKLSNSDELVFRAQFNDEKPPQGPYYWRAIIHDEFDGKTWLISDTLKQTQTHKPIKHNVANESLQRYQIFAEPSSQPWLYGLAVATSEHGDIKVTEDGLLLRSQFLSNSINYSVKSAPLSSMPISRWQRLQNIQIDLAENTNQQTQSLAKNLFSANDNDPQRFYSAMYNYFSSNGFSYTLTPDPMTGDNTLDQFLFSNKRGFCGHYASSAAFMFRSIGIPARVVSGYLGGEYNIKSGYMSVYQYDAHAWVEVYIKNRWTIFDATAVVSPERLNGSLSQHQSLSDEFTSNLGFGLLRLSNIAGFNWLRIKLENLDYQWTSWVLGFDQQKQSSFLKDIFGNKQLWQIALIALATVTLIFIGYFIYLSWPYSSKSSTHPIVNDYLKIEQWLIKKNIKPESNETPLLYLQRASYALPEKSNYIEQFKQLYSDVRYRQLVFSAYRKKRSSDLVKLIKTKTKRKQ